VNASAKDHPGRGIPPSRMFAIFEARVGPGRAVATMSAGSAAPQGRHSSAPGPTAPAADSSRVSWALPRGVVVLLGTAGAVLTTAGLRGMSDIVGPVFLALVLTIAVSPLRRLLVRRGFRGSIAALVALVTVNAFLLGLAAALAFSAAKLATLLPSYEDKFADLVGDARGWLADRGIGDQQLEAALQRFGQGTSATATTRYPLLPGTRPTMSALIRHSLAAVALS
jgi:AI-2 transport protein TqsA